jgi:hypothetical protein
MTWNAGGNYNWQIYDATGAAGLGWDLITGGGSLDLSGLDSANKFNLNLWSLSSIVPDFGGPALNFDNTQSYTWSILRMSGGVTGFDNDYFNINVGATNGTEGFLNSLGGGSFSLVTYDAGDGSPIDLNLVFTPGGVNPGVPEPGTWAAGALLAGGAALMRWRKRKQVS